MFCTGKARPPGRSGLGAERIISACQFASRRMLTEKSPSVYGLRRSSRCPDTGCKLESEILNQLQGACSATLLEYRPKEFSLRLSGRVESRHGYSSSRCDSRGFQHDCVESGRGMGAEPEWPRFRGPDANPVVAKGRLPEKWSKTENVEWAAEIQGRGWSSPIVNGSNVFVTTVTTEGKSKAPQIGTEYSNEYVAELMKQGLSEQEVLKRVTARDIELPKEVMLHYYLYCLDIQTGKVVWKREFYSGQPPGGRHRKNSFASETPVTDGNLVYVYVANLGLYAYDMKGTQVWHTPLKRIRFTWTSVREDHRRSWGTCC